MEDFRAGAARFARDAGACAFFALRVLVAAIAWSVSFTTSPASRSRSARWEEDPRVSYPLMKDLTQGPIPKHVVALAIPMIAGMMLQTLYFFVDLYFVSRLGDAAIAGVSVAGNLMFVAFFLTQMLGVGTVALVSQAVGRKDRDAANHAFNQATGLALVLTVVTALGGYALIGPYTRFFAPDEPARAAGVTFLSWFIPCLVLQFPLVLVGSGLRGTGIVKPTMVVQAVTVLMNAILAPILIAGWGTGAPLGVAGAGLASSLSAAIGVAFLAVYFIRLERYIGFDLREWKPDWGTWRRLVNIGLPAGGEFMLMAIFVSIMYWAARDFGTAAQAGVGLGFRVNQMLFVPALAIAFAAAPIAGQNYGARLGGRVRETFAAAALYISAVMAVCTMVVQWKAEALAGFFTSDPAVVASAVVFLHYLSWNFVATGILVTCSSLFQGMGNTWPALASSAIRIVIFAVPAVWMSGRPGFELRDVFALSVATVFIQAVMTFAWLRVEFRRRLGPELAPRPQAPQGA
jgi:putative MATE family efflux protein